MIATPAGKTTARTMIVVLLDPLLLPPPFGVCTEEDDGVEEEGGKDEVGSRSVDDELRLSGDEEDVVV